MSAVNLKVEKPKKELNAFDTIKGMAYKKKVFLYDSVALTIEMQKFYEDKKHEIKPFELGYEPNPWVWQYDLEVHIFLNYKTLNEREKEILEKSINALEKKQNINPGEKARLAKLKDRLEFVEKRGFTGFPRYEHLWNAFHIRWPQTELYSGQLSGQLVRHPWAEDFTKAISENRFVAVFGGAGQGKTHVPAAFCIVLWDHFIFHQYGARCSMSTVSEDKLKNAIWKYITMLYRNATEGREYSLYAEKGVVSGDYEVTRKVSGSKRKDTGSIIKGVLIQQGDKSNRSVDKLTGAHGHPVYVYIMDEAQSTSDAPITAARNYMQKPKWSWVCMCGNHGVDGDLLDRNVEPKYGWDTVDENTHTWVGELSSLTERLGDPVSVIHLNNNLSPAIVVPNGHIKWPFLPNAIHKKRDYGTPGAEKTEGYRRFWIGWRKSGKFANTVVDYDAAKEQNAHMKAYFSSLRPKIQILSFDSAPSSDTGNDRNPLTMLEVGIEEGTNKSIINIARIFTVATNANRKDYYKASIGDIDKIAKNLRINKTDIVLDQTQNLSHLEELTNLGWQPFPVIYNAKIPDGKTRDPYTGFKEMSITVDEFGKKGHQVASCQIALGAWAFRQYWMNGHIRGLNEDLLMSLNDYSHKGFHKEFCTREYEMTTGPGGIELFSLTNKKEFRKKYGFSPDLLDTIFQACYYILAKKNFIPGIGITDENRDIFQTIDEDDDDDFSAFSIWENSYMDDLG